MKEYTRVATLMDQYNEYAAQEIVCLEELKRLGNGLVNEIFFAATGLQVNEIAIPTAFRWRDDFMLCSDLYATVRARGGHIVEMRTSSFEAANFRNHIGMNPDLVPLTKFDNVLWTWGLRIGHFATGLDVAVGVRR